MEFRFVKTAIDFADTKVSFTETQTCLLSNPIIATCNLQHAPGTHCAWNECGITVKWLLSLLKPSKYYYENTFEKYVGFANAKKLFAWPELVHVFLWDASL